MLLIFVYLLGIARHEVKSRFLTNKSPSTKAKRELKYSIQNSNRKTYNKSQKIVPGYMASLSNSNKSTKCNSGMNKHKQKHKHKHLAKQSIDFNKKNTTTVLKTLDIYSSPYDGMKDKESRKSVSNNPISKLIKKTKVFHTAGKKKVDYTQYLSVNPNKIINFDKSSERSKWTLESINNRYLGIVYS